MKNTFGTFFMQPWVIRIIGNSGLNRKLYLNALENETFQRLFTKGVTVYEDYHYDHLSKVTLQYIEKLYTLCVEKNVKLHMIPGPIADNELRREQIERIKPDFMNSELGKLFSDYFEQIVFYPEEIFRDGIHFNEENRDHEHLNLVIEDMQKSTGCMTDLYFYAEE